MPTKGGRDTWTLNTVPSQDPWSSELCKKIMVENPVICLKSSVIIVTNLDISLTDVRNPRNLEILTEAEKYHANYLEKKEKKRQEREKAEKEFRQQYAEGKIGATETLGMMREQRLLKQETKEYLEGLQGKGATPNKGKQPEALQQVDNILVRVTLRDTEQIFQKEREAGAKICTYYNRQSRHMGHRGGVARETARYLCK
ncbi:Uncharacterized protein HZ326_28581 [Fusarium oxysporum f. sp. albedinis]|nr:Uncharacterized protein HZ326_31206 [Fusarium oxysporum f. sp. albedinis]KAJ0128323.1 Uncharacterized protein HZ326_28581 [Fusarium oxysporum f. sp. albedinis]